MSDEEKTDKNARVAMPGPDEASDTLLPEEFQKYVWPVTIALIAGCAVLFFRMSKQNETAAKTEAASAALAAAQPQDVAALQQVVSAYGDTATGPIATLKLGQAQYHLANYEGATAAYNSFISTYPTHDMVPVAELGLIHCREAQAVDKSAALKEYDAFLVKHAALTYLVPQATFGKARCLISMGDLKGARAVYDDFIAAQEEDSDLVTLAEEYLQRLDIKEKRAKGQL